MNKFIKSDKDSFKQALTFFSFLLAYIAMMGITPEKSLSAQSVQLNDQESLLHQPVEADDRWNLQSTIPGLNGGVEVMIRHEENIYVAGSFNVAGGVKTGSVAKYNIENDTWHGLIENLRGDPNALLISGDYLYIGGSNLQVDDSGHISSIRYNLTTDSWQEFGNGMENITALYDDGRFLYFGGRFQGQDDSEVYLKRYNSSNETWHDYDLSRFNYAVINDMEIIESNLYLGGQFIIDENERNSLIKLKVDDSSIQIIEGLYYTGNVLLKYGTDLFVAGQMDTPDEAGTDYLARFDTVNEVLKPISGNLNSFVNDIQIYGDYLYAGGHFTRTGDGNASRVARYHLDTDTWAPLEKNIMGDDLTHEVRALQLINGELILGGSFSNSSGITVNNVLRYNTTEKTIKTLGDGLSDQVYSIASSGDNIFVTGMFKSVGSLKANYIARFNTSTQTWHTLGEGLDRAAHHLFAYDNYLVAGGPFNRAGGEENNHLARYNINTGEWDDMNGGANGWVLSSILHKDNLYVGGGFTEIGGISASRIARYHIPTSKWYKLENEVDGPVYSMAIGEGNLFAGGTFNSADGFTVNKVARYNFEDKNWYKMDGGLSHEVKSMVYSDGHVYIGGNFYRWDDEYPRYLAAYDIANDSFYTLDLEGHQEVFDLYLDGKDLYISTVFPQEYIGPIKYDLEKDNWQYLGSGTNQTVRSMEMSGQVLYVGGLFTIAGNKTAGYLARWDLGIPVSVEPEIIDSDDDYQILQNYPNPFNPTTRITYVLPESGHVRLSVFNVTGQQVATLVDAVKTAGRQSTLFNAGGLSSGIYFYRLETGGNVLTRKMSLIK